MWCSAADSYLKLLYKVVRAASLDMVFMVELCRHHFRMDGTRWVTILQYGTLVVTILL